MRALPVGCCDVTVQPVVRSSSPTVLDQVKWAIGSAPR